MDLLDALRRPELDWFFDLVDSHGARGTAELMAEVASVARSVMGATMSQPFGADGEALHDLPDGQSFAPGLAGAVQRALRTGRPDRSGLLAVYPVVHAGVPRAAVALELPKAANDPRRENDLERLLRIAGLLLVAGKDAESRAGRIVSPVSGTATEGERLTLPGVVGEGPKMQELIFEARQFASSPAPVLITGEAGSGKGCIARAIHDCSPRAHHPFYVIELTSLEKSLIQTELCGIGKGIATDVVARQGRLAAAGEGTLFFDEIGDLPLELQPILLRVIDEKKYTPTGATEPVIVRARIIAATNKDLKALVQRDLFREDLYQRLNVLKLEVPPLREHMEDFEAMVRLFTRSWKGRRVTEDGIVALMQQDPPVNPRDLRNQLTRLELLCKGDVTGADVRARLKLVPRADSDTSLKGRKEKVTKQALLEAWVLSGGDTLKMASHLKITRRTVQILIAKYGVPEPPARLA